MKSVSRLEYFVATLNMKKLTKTETRFSTTWLDENKEVFAEMKKDNNSKNTFYLKENYK